ncbi:MAG: type II secretion system F family protein [Syntrophaceae bacterium]
MPIFQYKGYAADGSEVRGSIDAPGLRDAITQIKDRKVLPTDVVESVRRKKKGIFQRKDESFLPNMTRQLSILISSGVPIMDALQSLSDEYQGYYREMLVTIKERVSGGASLNRAMQEYSDIFPEHYVHMVQAGEASGALDVVLVKLADFLEHQSIVRSKVRSSMVYPILMIGVSIVVLSFLFTFVIPKIVKIFADTKSTLPLISIILISMSNIFVKYWWAVIGVLLCVIMFIKKYVREHREKTDRLILKLPGDIIQSLYYARFARSMEVLLSGGLPVLTALKLAAASMGNKALEISVLRAGEKVAEGQTIASSLQEFPPVFVRLVATGEKSGKLAETLKRAAASYEEEFNRKVDRTVSIFEPAMIIVMGLVVCFIVLAVLLPIFQLNQLVK